MYKLFSGAAGRRFTHSILAVSSAIAALWVSPGASI
jgi:hypothetical protein